MGVSTVLNKSLFYFLCIILVLCPRASSHSEAERAHCVVGFESTGVSVLLHNESVRGFSLVSLLNLRFGPASQRGGSGFQSGFTTESVFQFGLYNESM